MCGLIFVLQKNKGRSRKKVWKIYESQRARGTEGYGYIAMKDNKIEKIFRATNEAAMKKELLDEGDVSSFLFHHRMPTSTDNVIEGTHPIYVSNKELEFDYYVIHNGVIRNEEELKVKHDKLGYEYTTLMTEQLKTRGKTYDVAEKWNDSEGLAIELARYFENKQESIDAKGSIAFITIRVDKKTHVANLLLFGRNFSNPLLISNNDHFLTLSSAGGGTEIKVETLYQIDLNTMAMMETPMAVGKVETWHNHAGVGYNRDGNRSVGSDKGYGNNWAQGRIWDYTTQQYIDPPAHNIERYTDIDDEISALNSDAKNKVGIPSYRFDKEKNLYLPVPRDKKDLEDKLSDGIELEEQLEIIEADLVVERASLRKAIEEDDEVAVEDARFNISALEGELEATRFDYINVMNEMEYPENKETELPFNS